MQPQQLPLPSKRGEWCRGGWIAYAGDAYIIFLHENTLILLLSASFRTCINDFWKIDLFKAGIFHVPNYMH